MGSTHLSRKIKLLINLLKFIIKLKNMINDLSNDVEHFIEPNSNTGCLLNKIVLMSTIWMNSCTGMNRGKTQQMWWASCNSLQIKVCPLSGPFANKSLKRIMRRTWSTGIWNTELLELRHPKKELDVDRSRTPPRSRIFPWGA